MNCATPCAPARLTMCWSNLLSCQIRRAKNPVGRPFACATVASVAQDFRRDRGWGDRRAFGLALVGEFGRERHLDFRFAPRRRQAVALREEVVNHSREETGLMIGAPALERHGLRAVFRRPRHQNRGRQQQQTENCNQYPHVGTKSPHAASGMRRPADHSGCRLRNSPSLKGRVMRVNADRFVKSLRHSKGHIGD
jgi:hypothetical protein